MASISGALCLLCISVGVRLATISDDWRRLALPPPRGAKAAAIAVLFERRVCGRFREISDHLHRDIMVRENREGTSLVSKKHGMGPGPACRRIHGVAVAGDPLQGPTLRASVVALWSVDVFLGPTPQDARLFQRLYPSGSSRPPPSVRLRGRCQSRPWASCIQAATPPPFEEWRAGLPRTGLPP